MVQKVDGNPATRPGLGSMANRAAELLAQDLRGGGSSNGKPISGEVTPLAQLPQPNYNRLEAERILDSIEKYGKDSRIDRSGLSQP